MTSRPLSRRSVLAAGAVMLGAGGCSLNNPFDDAKTPATEAVQDLSTDVALAVTAAAAIRDQQERLAATVAAFPAFAAFADRFGPVHEAHLAALIAAVPHDVDIEPSAPPHVPSKNPSGARKVAIFGEEQLHSTLTALALRAESGAFARLLGSMAASISQHQALAR